MYLNKDIVKKSVSTLSILGLLTVSLISAPATVLADSTATIAENAQNTEELSTLVTALDTAGLVDTFNDESASFTVFAPTNDAFTALTQELDITTDQLLALPNLGDILRYHVVDSAVMSSDLSDGQVIETLTGETLTVRIEDSNVFIVDGQDRRAQVTTADVESSNGVVHIIDNVVLEAEESETPALSDTGVNPLYFYGAIAGSLLVIAFVGRSIVRV